MTHSIEVLSLSMQSFSVALYTNILPRVIRLGLLADAPGGVLDIGILGILALVAPTGRLELDGLVGGVGMGSVGVVEYM